MTTEVIESNGLTKQDEYLRELAEEAEDAENKLKDATWTWMQAKEKAKGAKKAMESAQSHVNDLMHDIASVRRGEYQPPLAHFKSSVSGVPGPEGTDPDNDLNAAAGGLKATPFDEGGAAPLSALVGYCFDAEEGAVTEKMVELILESQLATEHSIKTVGDLERVINADEWWHRKIKGMGAKKINVISGGLMMYRNDYPVPCAEDDDDEIVDADFEPDRNAKGVGLTECTDVLQWIYEPEDDSWSVMLSVGSGDAGTFQSCVQWRWGKEGENCGRSVPYAESQPHRDEQEAAQAAISELATLWTEVGGEHAEAAMTLQELFGKGEDI